MKTMIEYLDQVKDELTLPSDYALAKALDVTRETVSQMRRGKMHMSDVMALRVADLLGMSAGEVLLDMHIERSKTPELRAAWSNVMEKISASFNDLILGASPLWLRVPGR